MTIVAVVAEVDLGAKLSILLWVAIGSLIGGVLAIGGSTVSRKFRHAIWALDPI